MLRDNLVTVDAKLVLTQSPSLMTEINLLYPGFVGKWAVLIFLFAFGLFISNVWLITSPEIIHAPATLREINQEQTSLYVELRAPNELRRFRKDITKVINSGDTVDIVITQSNIKEVVRGKLFYLTGTEFDKLYVANIFLPHGMVSRSNRAVEFRDGLAVEIQVTRISTLYEVFLGTTK